MDNVYKQHGYANRDEYLNSLAEEYGVAKMLVYNLAEMLGPNEDFDGLVNALEDMQEDNNDNQDMQTMWRAQTY